MQIDPYGNAYFTSDELCVNLYRNPELTLDTIFISDPDSFNNSNNALYAGYKPLTKYVEPSGSITEFDAKNQAEWYMPKDYHQFDIVEWLISKCKTDAELSRVSDELIKFQDRNLFNLLRFMKYFVDTLRKNNIVWGVGRGSSTSSYVLYLIGVHKINSLKYELDITEFLK